MFEFNGWQFSTAIPSVLASSIIFCLSVYLSVRTWSKNGKKKKVAALELVRTLSVLFLLITLLNPEKIEKNGDSGSCGVALANERAPGAPRVL